MSLYWGCFAQKCVSVLCENQTRVLDLRSMCVCVLAILKRMAENWSLELWQMNQANTIVGKWGFICSTCMTLVKQKCSKCFTSKYLLVFSHELETESSQMSIVLPVIWLHRRSLPDVLVFWSEGFAWTIFAWGSQMFTFIMCFGL